ncbi:MAG: hypothetical protein ACO1RT_17905, partial [Planctomycetaceae bacterium]
MLIRESFIAVVIGLGLLGLTGCDRQIDRFATNDLYGLVTSRREAMDQAPDLREVETVVANLFGTPDGPRLPTSLKLDSWLSEANLQRAA